MTKKKTMNSSFYSNKFKYCGNCIHRDVCKHEKILDEFKVERCSKEINYFNDLLKSFKSQFMITKCDEPMLQRAIMAIIRVSRMDSDIAFDGETIKVPQFNPRTGKVLYTLQEHPLKKEIRHEEKIIRDWFAALKATPKSKNETADHLDIAIKFK